jgi:hypothetical protein
MSQHCSIVKVVKSRRDQQIGSKIQAESELVEMGRKINRRIHPALVWLQ